MGRTATSAPKSSSPILTPARAKTTPAPLAEMATPHQQHADSQMQLDDNLPDPDNRRVELSKLFTPSPKQSPKIQATPLSKYFDRATSTSRQTSSSPHSDFNAGEATDAKMDHDKVAKKIRDQIQEDHATDVASILEESLKKSLERPLPLWQPTSFFKPTKKVNKMVLAYRQGPSRLFQSSITTTTVKDPLGHARLFPTTARDISQPEPPKIPEYSRYITIERSFHAKRPELPPNPRKPEKTADKSIEEVVAERSEEIEEIRKMRELEKAQSLRPYRAQIHKAIRRAKAEGVESESRMKAALRKVLDIDEDGLRSLLYGRDRAQTAQSPIEEAESNFLLGCLACATHQCFSHGVYDEPRPSNSTSKAGSIGYTKDSKHPERQLKGFTRHVEAKTSDYGDFVPLNDDTELHKCDNTCYREDTDEQRNGILQITTNSADAIMLAYGLDVREPCDIAGMLSLPCKEVHQYMVSAGLEIGARVLLPKRPPPENKSKVYPTNEHAHHQRSQPTPCHHPGLSCSKAGNKKCLCVQQNIYCYKTCGCHASCTRRYPGCNCTGLKGHGCARAIVADADADARVQKCLHAERVNGCKGCMMKRLDAEPTQCLCQRINRECDPEVCQCGVADILEDKEGEKACRNCDIQKGGMKDMVVGISTEAGYGLFLNEPVKYEDYLGEYVGEIITHHEEYHRREAERITGDPNYMFQINKDFDVDSAHSGNLTRFINHSQKQPNCASVVKLIDGEHRIGFFSIRNLSAGTELFFDYGKDFENELPLAYVKKGGAIARGAVAKHGTQPNFRETDRGGVGRRADGETHDDEGDEDEDGDIQMATKDDTEDDDDEGADDEDDEYTE